jgi:hypothetical protein
MKYICTPSYLFFTSIVSTVKYQYLSRVLYVWQYYFLKLLWVHEMGSKTRSFSSFVKREARKDQERSRRAIGSVRGACVLRFSP